MRVGESMIGLTAEEDKFCHSCGKILMGKRGIGFDTRTGEPIVVRVCHNEKCQNGCANVGTGHRQSFWSGKCKRCGRTKWRSEF